MAVHFRHEIVEAGKWRRYSAPQGEHGSVDEDRPHFIAHTEEADKFVALDVSGVAGNTGLPPGWVTLPDGSEARAYRFRLLDATDEAIESMLVDLDDAVAKILQLPKHGCGH